MKTKHTAHIISFATAAAHQRVEDADLDMAIALADAEHEIATQLQLEAEDRIDDLLVMLDAEREDAKVSDALDEDA